MGQSPRQHELPGREPAYCPGDQLLGCVVSEVERRPASAQPTTRTRRGRRWRGNRCHLSVGVRAACRSTRHGLLAPSLEMLFEFVQHLGVELGGLAVVHEIRTMRRTLAG